MEWRNKRREISGFIQTAAGAAVFFAVGVVAADASQNMPDQCIIEA